MIPTGETFYDDQVKKVFTQGYQATEEKKSVAFLFLQRYVATSK
ncbi:MAG TPA: hypothetical protein PKC87_02555 [Candidatus Absconditabacterales bacterium]|nr:hypothetical protein [Candidatus Absconditabacterales bacterium]